MADNEFEAEAGRGMADRVFVNGSSLGALADEVAKALSLDVVGRAAVA